MRHDTGRLALAMALTLVGYLLIYRAQQLRWGATHDQVMRAMPGDDIQRQPVFTANRAITISARPEEIWPWLMQMGHRCGGWYGYRPDRQRRHSQHREGSPGVAASEGGDTVPIWRNLDFPVVALWKRIDIWFLRPE